MTAKWKRRIVVLAVVVVAVWWFHATLLRGLAGFLIVDQPTDDVDCVCILSWGDVPDGDRCYDVAAELYRRKPSSSVLLVAPDANRLEEIGAATPFESISRRELGDRGVPAAAISAIRCERWNDWATARSRRGVGAGSPGAFRACVVRAVSQCAVASDVGQRARRGRGLVGSGASVAEPGIRRNELVEEPAGFSGLWSQLVHAAPKLAGRRRCRAAARSERRRSTSRSS